MNSNKKKILFISGRFPYPLHKGDQLMLFNNIKLISQKYSVTLITFYDSESELDGLHKVERYCEKIILVRRIAILSYINIFLSIFRLEPLQVSYYRSGLFKKKLDALLDVDKYDVVHVYMLRMAHYVRNISTCKVISLIDSMHLNMSRRATNETGFKKIVFKYEALLLKTYEAKCLEWFDNGIVVSEIDKRHINHPSVRVIPVGVDAQKSGNYNESKTILFSGNMGYFPNQNAVNWFVNNCLKMIIEKVPDVHFIVVGRNPPKSLIKLSDNINIFVKGFVNSMQDEMQNASISVAPMQSGSGMQIKVLESMAAGLPMVATKLGVGDIGARDGRDILIADTPNEFVSKCLLLLLNKDQRVAIGNSAIDYVNKNYSWRVVKEQYLDLYDESISSYKRQRIL